MARFLDAVRGFVAFAVLSAAAVALLAVPALMAAAPVASAAVVPVSGGMPYHGHVFPVAGPHGLRGPVGEWGAPRSGGRIHEGVDITAACGTPLVAVRNGRVRRRGFDPVLYGHYVLIGGEGERRAYFYAHLRAPAAVRRGQWVFEGRRLGAVGETGNARGTGCHLHFEIHRGSRPIDPTRPLRRWDRYS